MLFIVPPDKLFVNNKSKQVELDKVPLPPYNHGKEFVLHCALGCLPLVHFELKNTSLESCTGT